jgi:large subunit ribosomal protein L21
MFAVIKAGGRQYRVATDDVIEVDRMVGEVGDKVTFGEVLMVGGGDAAPVLGDPTIAGASVAGEVVDHTRARKVIAFKKRRRKNSRRIRGHRQQLTLVRITAIDTDAARPKRASRAESEPAAEAAAEGAAE